MVGTRATPVLTVVHTSVCVHPDVSAGQVVTQQLLSLEALPGHPDSQQGYARADDGAMQSSDILTGVQSVIETVLGAKTRPDQPLMEVCAMYIGTSQNAT